MSRSHNRDTLNNLNVELKLASNVLVSEKSIICQWCSWKNWFAGGSFHCSSVLLHNSF